jgi:hypothetical protein
MYTATGGSLQGLIATPDFVPGYPTDGLPGGVHPGLVVSLLPVGSQALMIFMSIEYPDVTPVVQQPATPPPPTPPDPPTIGQFYQTIAAGFNTVFPDGSLPNNPSLNQVVTQVGPDPLFAINTVADALTAIQEITEQGEGTNTNPDEGTFDPGKLAHYYTFAELGHEHHHANGVQLHSAAAEPARSDHIHQHLHDIDDAVGTVLDQRLQHRHSHQHVDVRIKNGRRHLNPGRRCPAVPLRGSQHSHTRVAQGRGFAMAPESPDSRSEVRA